MNRIALSLVALLLAAPAAAERVTEFVTDRAGFAQGLTPRPRLETKGASPQCKGVCIEDDAPLVGSPVLFDFDDSRVKQESQPTLRELASALIRDLPNGVILIAGHADTKGEIIYNQGLSERRAEAVRGFLVAQGVPPQRLRTIGYGEGHPLCGNETEAHRAQNRRVEFMTVAVLDPNGRVVRSFEAKPGKRKKGGCG